MERMTQGKKGEGDDGGIGNAAMLKAQKAVADRQATAAGTVSQPISLFLVYFPALAGFRVYGGVAMTLYSNLPTGKFTLL
jgi:hypothetical protein